MKKLLTSLTLAFAMIAPQAHAGMIQTPDTAPVGAERERIKALVARPELAKALEKQGIPAADVQARIDAMTDQEVHALAGRIDSLPAAGDMTTQEWLLLIIVILLVIIVI
ncbi:MAG TPA: PA2779 family protein [Burkholderiales bacterium]|jgi:hypothetical protein